MPGYYNNPYYPATYQSPLAMGQASFAPYNGYMPQQSYANGPSCAMGWVEGEIEARGRQMPQGVTQYAMWDTNQQKIYVKSLNQMGMPNPMQILTYTVEEQPAQSALPSGGVNSNSGNNMSGGDHPDMSQYVTKDDLEQLKNEIRSLNKSQAGMSSGNNQNGNNRGGSR